MKYVLKQDEVKKIVSDTLQSRFQSGCEFVCTSSPSYGDWTFEEATPEFKEEQATHDAYMADLMAKYKAEDEAKKAAEQAVDIAAQPGPF